MSVKKSIGRITAYAAAVEGGYTGTYEQFCRDQAKFVENAAEVAENLRESKQVLEDVKKESAGLVGLSAKVEGHTSRLDSAEERITALEERTVTAPYYVDGFVAYIKAVPKNALPLATEVNKIGGMTYKVNVGTEEAPVYELRSAAVTEVESVGVNLIAYPFDEQSKTSGGVTWTADNGGVTGAGIPTGAVWLTLGNLYVRSLPSKIIYVNLFGDYQNMRLHMELFREDGNSITTIYLSEANSINLNDYVDVYRIRVRVYRHFNNTPVSGTMYPIISMIPVSEYIPYRSDTLSIPAAVQALPGYGQGNPDKPSEYNAIVWGNNGKVSYSHKGDITDGVWIPLATAENTDISNLFTDDNYIPVEPGGTITMVNEHGYDVPSEITFARLTWQ